MADDKSANPFMDMFQNFGSSLNIPAPDLNALMDYHRKNLQALQAATHIGTQASQEMLNKQRAALEEVLADIADAVQDAQGGADPAAMMTSQMEIAKKSFDTTVRNATEMSGIVQKGGTEAMEVLKDRVMESIAEMTGQKKD